MKENGKNYQPWEKSFDNITTPLEEFIHDETTSGLVLMLCTVIAMVLANSVLVHYYEHILHLEIAFSFAGFELRHTLHHWINDGLMAFFFMVVGLEIKREVIVGELSDPKAALLPVIAAIGGMAVPALLFYGMNADTPSAIGWGVPMATDLAFAVGVLVLLGSRVPKTVLTFLVGLAIVDDLGAVAVIAIFYTDQIFMNWLILAGAMIAILVTLNRVGVRNPIPYFVVGSVVWLGMLQSGIHATLAGVLIALTIPVKPKFDIDSFIEHVNDVVVDLKSSRKAFIGHESEQAFTVIHDNQSRALLQTLENGVHSVESPLQRLEHAMHMPVALLVIPLFALANAGIPIEWSQLGNTIMEPTALGVIVGLVLGKLIGIAGITWVAIKLGLGNLPQGMTVNHLIGVGLIGGIGFTMSIFIAELGFSGQPEALLMAKTGILVASILAGVSGYLWLRFTSEPCD